MSRWQYEVLEKGKGKPYCNIANIAYKKSTAVRNLDNQLWLVTVLVIQ